MSRRLVALLGLMVALLAGGLLWNREPEALEELVEATSRSRPTSATVSASQPGSAASSAASVQAGIRSVAKPAAEPEVLPRTTLRATVDLFGIQMVPRPAAPASVAEAPVPAPQPRPGFAFIGRVLDGVEPMAVVRDASAVQTVRSGSRISGWRVRTVGEDALELVHEQSGAMHRMRMGTGGAGVAAAPARLAAADADDGDMPETDGVRRDR